MLDRSTRTKKHFRLRISTAKCKMLTFTRPRSPIREHKVRSSRRRARNAAPLASLVPSKRKPSSWKNQRDKSVSASASAWASTCRVTQHMRRRHALGQQKKEKYIGTRDKATHCVEPSNGGKRLLQRNKARYLVARETTGRVRRNIFSHASSQAQRKSRKSRRPVPQRRGLGIELHGCFLHPSLEKP